MLVHTNENGNYDINDLTREQFDTLCEALKYSYDNHAQWILLKLIC